MRYLILNQSDDVVENVIIGPDDDIFGADQDRWIKCPSSIDNTIPPAGIGMIYLREQNRFAFPSPFPSWTYSTSQNCWIPPVEFPSDPADAGTYSWDEKDQIWKLDSP